VNGSESHSQLLADGVLPLDRERIGDACDGGGDVGGVQSGEDEVAGFGGGNGDAHGFRVAHFADNDDIGSLPKSGAEGGRKVGRVRPDFDLLDHRAQVVMLILDGIFDHDDVAGFAAIDIVDQGSEGRGFAGTGRATDQDEATWETRESFH
jgi:hypothetical protein